MKYNIFFYFYPGFRTFFRGSGSGFFRIGSGFLAEPGLDPDSEKKSDPDPGKKTGSETLQFLFFYKKNVWELTLLFVSHISMGRMQMRRKIPIPAKCSGSRCASLNSTSSLFYLSVHVLLLYCDVLMFSFADLPLIFFSSLYCFLFVLLQSSLLFIIECTLGLRQKYFREICLQFTV